MDKHVLKHIVDVLLCLFKLKGIEFIEWGVDGWGLVFQIGVKLMGLPCQWHILRRFRWENVCIMFQDLPNNGG